MKNSDKKIICGLVACAMSISVVSPAFAASKNDTGYHNVVVCGGDSMGDRDVSFTCEAQIERYQDVLKSETASETYKDTARKLINILSRNTSKNEVINTAKTLVAQRKESGENWTRWINTPMLKQETNYWCGPATTLQTLSATGKSGGETQSSIASKLGTTSAGTDGLNIVNLLNNKGLSYAVRSADDATLLWSDFLLSIERQAPPVLRVSFSSGEGWDYSTSGHYMSVCGVTANEGGGSATNESAYIVDPYIKWIKPNAGDNYDKSIPKVFQAIKNHWASHYYYTPW